MFGELYNFQEVLPENLKTSSVLFKKRSKLYLIVLRTLLAALTEDILEGEGAFAGIAG